MPEPQDEKKDTEESKSSMILDFFSTSVKETKKEKIKPLTKIVVRRLPPRLTKEAFKEEFELPDHDYFCFIRGDLSLGQNAFSRAYINFKKTDDIFGFKEKYDDYFLQDEQGREYHAVVEWAPVQKIPKRSSQKKSSQAGTIESDQKYLDFLESLEKEKNNVTNSSGYFMETEGVSVKEVKVTTTPLLEFLKTRQQQKLALKLKRREAEKERRRKEDEARKMEKLKRVKEKKPQEPSDEAKDKDVTEVKEKRIEGKPSKTDKAEVLIKTRVFEKRGSRKETPDKNRNSTDAKPAKRETEVKKNPKAPPKPVAETTTAKSNEGHKNAKKEEGDLRREPKSKFRYSEQRNRERAPKTQKKETTPIADKTEGDEKPETGRIRRQSTQETSDGSGEGDDKKEERNSKDPRLERRIRNKDRPTMQIYRPGMGRFSKQRIEQKDDEFASESDERASDSRSEQKKRSARKETGKIPSLKDDTETADVPKEADAETTNPL